MTDTTADETCPHCPRGHQSPTGGSQPWSAWVAPCRDGDGQPLQITVARSAGAHVAESDAQWVRERLNAPADQAAEEMALRSDGFTDEDTAALAKLRRVADEAQPVTKPEHADRAATLREAATRYEEILANADTGQDPRYWTAVRDVALGLRAMADEAGQAGGPSRGAAEPQPETQAATCGRTKSVCGTEYPPCARPAGHEEAYCRSADGKQHFLTAGAQQDGAQP